MTLLDTLLLSPPFELFTTTTTTPSSGHFEMAIVYVPGIVLAEVFG